MRHENLLDSRTAALVVVDLQEAFRSTIHEFDQIVKRTAIMIETARLLDLPILATEQVPAKLGGTVAELRRAMGDSVRPFQKSAFSSCGCGSFVERLAGTGRTQILLAGIEAHVCMNQTAHD